jgi:hypothetical protein
VRKDHETDLVCELKTPCREEWHKYRTVDDLGVVVGWIGEPEEVEGARDGQWEEAKNRHKDGAAAGLLVLVDVCVAFEYILETGSPSRSETNLVTTLKATPTAPNAMNASLNL